MTTPARRWACGRVGPRVGQLRVFGVPQAGRRRVGGVDLLDLGGVLDHLGVGRHEVGEDVVARAVTTRSPDAGLVLATEVLDSGEEFGHFTNSWGDKMHTGPVGTWGDPGPDG